MSDGSAERSLLGGALSFEFSDCSIAAADLSKKACERIHADNSRTGVDCRIIGQEGEQRYDVVEPLVFVDKRSSEPCKIELDGQQLPLVLIHPTEKRQVAGKPVPERSRFLKRIVNVTPVIEREYLAGDPLIGLQITTQDILPLASFARREGGRCSYVQLGQEMEDDNYYVTTADDDTHRHALIEALRSMIKNPTPQNRNDATGRLSLEEFDTIGSFVAEQIELHRKQIDMIYEKQLVKESFSKLKYLADYRNLILLGANETINRGQYSTYSITQQVPLSEGGRAVELVLAQPKNDEPQDLNNGIIQILAVARGGVAIELGGVSEAIQGIDFKQAGLLATSQDSLLRDLYVHMTTSPDTGRIVVPDELKFERSGLSFEDSYVRACCSRLGLMEDFISGSVDAGTALKIERFFANPSEETMPYPDSVPLKQAYYRYQKKHERDRKLLAHFDIARKLDAELGPVRVCDDQLLYALDKLKSRKPVETVFNRVQIGKTLSDAVISAAIKHDGGIYNAVITGRPASMPHEPMKPIIDVYVDPAQPLLGHRNDAATLFRPENVSEITDILLRAYTD